jgi:hypothetical protein
MFLRTRFKKVPALEAWFWKAWAIGTSGVVIFFFSQAFGLLATLTILVLIVSEIALLWKFIASVRQKLPRKILSLACRPITFLGTFLLVNSFLFGSVTLRYGGIAGLAPSLAKLWINVLVATGIVACAVALGYTLLRMFRADFLPHRMRWFFAFALGLATLGLATFFLALLQHIDTPSLLALLGGALIVSRQAVRDILLWSVRRSVTIRVDMRKHALLVLHILLLVLFEMSFIYNSATILNAGFDSFHQYLTFPMEYLRHGGLTEFWWHSSFGFPQLGEMIFLLFAIALGVSGPFLINFALYVALYVALLQSLRLDLARENADRAHWLTALIVGCPVLASFGFGYLKIDLLYAVFCLAVFILARQWLTDTAASCPPRRFFVFFGLFAGVLLSVKYTAILLIGALFLALFCLSSRKVALVKHAFAVLAVAVLVMSPWLAKNWAVYRSPLYPIFAGQDRFFQATGRMCSASFQTFAASDMILGDAKYVRQTGVHPIDNLRLFRFELFNPADISIMNPGLWLLFILPFCGIAILSRKRLDTSQKLFFLFSLFFFLAWDAVLLGATWYLFPAFLTVALAFAGVRFTEMTERVFRGALPIVAITGLALVAGAHAPKHFVQSIRYANGNADIATVTKERSPEKATKFDLYERVNALLRQNHDAKIYSFLEPQGYFIEQSSKRFVLDYYGEKLRCFESDADIKRSLQTLGVQYVLGFTKRRASCESALDPNTNEICRSIERFDAFVANEHLRPLYSQDDGSVVIYAWE